MLGPLFGWMIHDLDPSAAGRALDRMRQALRAHETPGAVAFGSATWLITARRSQEPPEKTGAQS